MEELKERPLTLQMRVFISTVSSLKELDGTDQRKDLRTPTLRSFTINSQFFTFQLYPLPFQLVVLQVLVKPQDKEQLKLRKHFINAQFTSTQEETINISSSELESRLNKLVLHKDQTKV